MNFKQKHFIDSHKGVTLFFLLGLIIYFRQWDNPTAWVYAALHGGYGLLWVLKSRIFPDKNWEQPASLLWGVGVAWTGLSLYWLPGFLIMSTGSQAPAWLLGLTVFINVLGVFFHFASDMQKHTSLQLRPGKLITEGMFARIRNINYLGELLIYLSFALLAQHWLALLPVTFYTLGFWVPNMLKKDKSLSRYPEFADYKRKSNLFIPFLF